MTKKRDTPNPKSVLLSQAIVAGAGLGLPPNLQPPPGKAIVLLFVPLDEMIIRPMSEIQADLGLPWAAADGTGVWLDEL